MLDEAGGLLMSGDRESAGEENNDEVVEGATEPAVAVLELEKAVDENAEREAVGEDPEEEMPTRRARTDTHDPGAGEGSPRSPQPGVREAVYDYAMEKAASTARAATPSLMRPIARTLVTPEETIRKRQTAMSVSQGKVLCPSCGG